MVGTRIAQYTVLEKIGEGGMGAVWKARDEKLGRLVALKFLSRADGAESRGRFMQEARAASSLNHPGIVTIFDIFDHGDQACIAMELVEGSTLSRMIPSGGLPVREVARLGAQIADALAAAHRAGVIHRDIKPGNIMVTPDGRAKLLDFGLAKLAEIAAAPDDATQAAGDVRTGAGLILGTVNYMSPEQAQGKPVDTRSDIFSLGAVLYEMTTGAKAFEGDSVISTITAILRDEPKPIFADPAGRSSRLGEVISRCLKKDPAERVQTASDVSRALDDVLEAFRSSPSGQVIPGTAASSRAWMIGAAAALVALAGIAIWAIVARRAPAPAPIPAEAMVVRPFAPHLTGFKPGASFSPDEKFIVMAWDGGTLGQPSHIYTLPLAGGAPAPLTTGIEADGSPGYTPDGGTVFFTRARDSGPTAYRVPALGGDATLVAEGTANAVSRDGKFLIVTRSAGLGSAPAASGTFVVELSSGRQRQLLPPDPQFGVMGFSFSPGDEWVHFSHSTGNSPSEGFGNPVTAMRVPFGGGQPETVRLPALEGPGVHLTQTEFVAQGTVLQATLVDEATNARRRYLLRPDGTAPVLLPASVPFGDVAPDGRRVIATTNYLIQPLYRVPAFPKRGDTVTPEKVIESARSESSPKLAPDSSRLVVASTREGGSRVWVWNATLTEGRPLFEGRGNLAGSPAISPDGRWVALDARVNVTSPDIWIVPMAGGEATRLTDHAAEDNTPCFDGTGEWVYFTSDREGEQQLFKVARTGGPQTRVTQHGGFSCQPSPDGKYLYYLQSRAKGGLFRLELATGKEEPVLPDYRNRNFKVLTDGIYLLDIETSSQAGLAARPGVAKFYRFSTRKVEDLGFTTPRPTSYTGIEISPDRKWLYFPMIDAQATDLQLVENLPRP